MGHAQAPPPMALPLHWSPIPWPGPGLDENAVSAIVSSNQRSKARHPLMASKPMFRMILLCDTRIVSSYKEYVSRGR